LSAFGGFDHNAQTLRVVTALERRYPDFDGLNLTWEALEGLVKHNGPLIDSAGAPLARYRQHGVPTSILDYCHLQDLQLWSFASAEAQVAAIADDIAYDAHDIDDGLRAKLFDLEEIVAVPLPGRIISAISADHPKLDHDRLVHELIRRLIGLLIDDVVAESAARLTEIKPHSADDVRCAAAPVGAFSPQVGEEDRAIKTFLRPRMYRHPRVMKVMDQAADVVRDLFARYSARPQDMPAEWGGQLVGRDEAARARHIADFIAGMTDRYALAEHARLFDSTPELR
jgi:dGTPase